MSKKNKRRKSDGVLGPIITVLKDGFLGGLLLIAISHGIHVFSTAEENAYRAKDEVMRQFTVTKFTLEQQINECINGRAVTSLENEKRIENRKKLVASAVKNKIALPANAYYDLIQFTRFDDSKKTQNLCSLNASELKSILNQIAHIEDEVLSDVRR
jgi:hypothetical protein